MENNNIQIIPYEQEDPKAGSFSFVNLVKRCIKNWYWFALSVLLCAAIASLYVLRTRPVYSRNATVLIKEAAARRMTTSDIESVLSFSGGSGMSSKVVNEVIAFQSPSLMQEVVRRLGLTTEYAVSGLFRSDVIYGTQVPVNVEFIDFPANVSVLLSISGSGDNAYSISKFTCTEKGEKIKLPAIKGVLGDTLSTAYGRVLVTRNAMCTDEWKNTIEVRKMSLEGATAMYSSRFTAEPKDVKNKSDVLSLILNDHSVQRADDVLNMLINVYNENWVEDKNKLAVSTSDFIEDRLVALERELGTVDDNISDYKSRNLLPDVSAVSELYMTQTKETAKMLQELNNQLYVFRSVRSYLSANQGTETLIPASTSISSSAISTQIAEYNKTLLNRNSIRSNSSARNPLVQDLTSALESMRVAIESAIDNQIGTLTSQIDNLRGIEKSNNTRIAKSPTQAKYLLSVGRQQKVKESLYLYLLQKREENELSQAFTAYNTRIITPPMGISRPTSPKKMYIFLIAMMLGLFIPFVVFYFLEVTDTKIRTRKDLVLLTLPFLGELPFHASEKVGHALSKLVGAKDSTSSEIVVKPGRRNIINEAFRVLRTNLEFMERGNKCPVIITSSYNPGSGKTFLSANLSAALSIKGYNVLAIDGDLRRASLSEYVNLPKKGITNYLSGEVEDVNSLVVPVPGFKNFSILPVGTIPPNPSELISLPIFPEMLERFKTKYDYIIIDCPPVDILADTQIVAEFADRTVFVVRAGLLDRKDVASLQQAYEDKRFKNLCYVFNGVETTVSYYGHYGHYGKKGEYAYYSSK